MKKRLKSVNISQSYKQERDCLMQFVLLAYARSGGIVNNHFTANLPMNLVVKKISKSTKI